MSDQERIDAIRQQLEHSQANLDDVLVEDVRWLLDQLVEARAERKALIEKVLEAAALMEGARADLVEVRAENQRLREALTIEPAESMALTVAVAQVQRGDHPPPNTTAVCVSTLARLRAALVPVNTEPETDVGAVQVGRPTRDGRETGQQAETSASSDEPTAAPVPPADVVSLLNRVDGQLGLAVYRNEHDQRWKDEAGELIAEIRRVLLGNTEETDQ